MTINKRIGSILLIIISILAVIITFAYVGRNETTKNFKQIFISDKKYDALTSSYTNVEFPLSTTISINGEDLIYDANTNTFYYSIVGSDSIHSSIISVKRDDTDSNKSTLKVFAYGEFPTTETISNGTNLELLLSDGESVSVSNLVWTTLPVMNIFLSAETVEELCLDETYAIADYAPCSICLYDNRDDFEGTSRSITSDAKIHMRGGTTIGAAQKSYRLSLLENKDEFDKDNETNLLGLREDDDWILYSAYSDYEKIRTPFCMNLWRDMAYKRNEWQVASSNEYKYIELFINNRYHGLYALTYPLDKKQFEAKEEESIFKKKDWSGTEFSLDLEYSESGGYYELPGYQLDYGTTDDFSHLHNLYYTMAYSEDNASIRQSCDMDNAIDLWLFYKLTQAVDNVYTTNVKNLFSCVKLSDNGIEGHKILFAPWDMDQTFGNRFVDGEGSHGIACYYNYPDYDLPMEWSPVYFLMENGDTEIVSEVQTRYNDLRHTVWSDSNINELVDEYQKSIYNSGAFVRTKERWPDGNYYDEEVGLDDFRQYVLDRLKYMDEYIAGLE